MKQTILLTIMLFIGLPDLLAQLETDTIQIRKIPGSGYSWDGNYLNSKKMKAVLLGHDEASQVYQRAIASRGTAIIFLLAGGVIAGGGLVMDPSIGIFKVIGGVFIVSSLSAFISYDVRINKAVNIYNNAIRQKYYPEKTVSIGLNSNGAGIRFNF